MATFQKCPAAVHELANSILCEFESHKPLLDCRVKIDLVFAYGEREEKTNNLLTDALKKNGIRALGITRKIPLKDRALGRGDAEVALDHDWWEEATETQRRALLDHELHHIAVKVDKRGVVRDDLQRPVIQMRKHDMEVGWFAIIAERHGEASIERQQAEMFYDDFNQAFWPALTDK